MADTAACQRSGGACGCMCRRGVSTLLHAACSALKALLASLQLLYSYTVAHTPALSMSSCSRACHVPCMYSHSSGCPQGAGSC